MSVTTLLVLVTLELSQMCLLSAADTSSCFQEDTTAASSFFTPENPWLDQVVLHIGDSQTRGPFGYHLGIEIREQGATAYVRHGETGKGIDWWLTNHRIQRLIQQSNPDILIITMGGNDARQFNSNTLEYQEKLERFIQVISSQVERFIWITPPVSIGSNASLQPLRSDITEEIIERLSNDDMFFVDSRTVSANYITANRTGDGIHFNNEGGRNWVEESIACIERKLLEQNEQQ